MTRPLTPSPSISSALSSPGLAALVEHARFLQKLDQRLRAALSGPLAEHVRVANLHEDRLVMLADSAVWASRLRYQRQLVLQTLWRAYSIRCRSFEVKVSPPSLR